MYQIMRLVSAKQKKYEKWAMRRRMMRCDRKWPHCAFYTDMINVPTHNLTWADNCII
jgi:hypothetical protein